MANSILHIRQIKQNFGIQFQCFERDSLLYIGEDAFLNEHLPARLLTPSNEEILRYNADVRGIAQAYIPLNNKSDHTGFLSNSQGNNMINLSMDTRVNFSRAQRIRQVSNGQLPASEKNVS